MDEQIKKIIEAALNARTFAHAPYSRFTVGAALLTESGRIFKGCNIENASFGATNCAERTAVFSALAGGEKHFSAMAVAGGAADQPVTDFCPPCGICRQVLIEFCPPDFPIILVDGENRIRQLPLHQLLPLSFGKEQLR